MSKKQYNTVTQPQSFEQNNQNLKKHKFSNNTAYNQNSNNPSTPIHNSNLNMNTGINNNPSNKNVYRRIKNI